MSLKKSDDSTTGIIIGCLIGLTVLISFFAYTDYSNKNTIADLQTPKCWLWVLNDSIAGYGVPVMNADFDHCAKLYERCNSTDYWNISSVWTDDIGDKKAGCVVFAQGVKNELY